ncbi:sucrose-6-phosphate hydrolase SacC (GH32 family) [Arthrobacter sp. SLBN-112]|nr:sucrose-6-phosphate hydrolase SacC (GH32 family) [Arthrobacter sp. SLBN-112]
MEIFAQDGQVTMTELIFPDPESVSLAIYASEGTATASSLKLTTLAAQ